MCGLRNLHRDRLCTLFSDLSVVLPPGILLDDLAEEDACFILGMDDSGIWNPDNVSCVTLQDDFPGSDEGLGPLPTEENDDAVGSENDFGDGDAEDEVFFDDEAVYEEWFQQQKHTNIHRADEAVTDEDEDFFDEWLQLQLKRLDANLNKDPGLEDPIAHAS